MALVLFDLGQTLEDDEHLLPGALETLRSVAALRDAAGTSVDLGLISDVREPRSATDALAIQQEYDDLLARLGIGQFFEPLRRHATLSSEAGVHKPDEVIFRDAAAKIDPALPLSAVLFVTENLDHVLAARDLGMTAVHVRGPGQPSGEIDRLTELVPIVREFVGAPLPVAGEVAVLRAKAGRGGDVVDAATRAGAAWVRLNDHVLVAGTSSELDGLIAETTRFAAATRHHEPLDQLHLVIQNGRLFEQHASGFRMLVDQGRHLVVAQDPRTTPDPDHPSSPCFAVQAVPWNTVVVDTRPAATPRRGASVLEDVVSTPAFRADLEVLVAFGTRHSTSTEFGKAAEHVSAELAAFGYQVTLQPITVEHGTSRNVIAERAGSAAGPREVVIVCAHLDSINIAGGAHAPAPGADDNGSGSAGVLAIARALQDQDHANDLRLVLFGGEEQGLHGSRQYVESLALSERRRIRAVVNMDMIGTRNTPAPTVLIEGAVLSQHVIDGLAEAAATHTDLVVQTSLHAFNSDHVPFLQQGIPAVLTIEGADDANSNIHGPDDTLDHVEPELALRILRTNLAYVSEALARP